MFYWAFKKQKIAKIRQSSVLTLLKWLEQIEKLPIVDSLTISIKAYKLTADSCVNGTHHHSSDKLPIVD